MTRALIRALEFMGWWIERFMGWFKGYARRRNMGSPELSVFLGFQIEQSLALKLDDPGDAAQVAALIGDKGEGAVVFTEVGGDSFRAAGAGYVEQLRNLTAADYNLVGTDYV